MADHGDDDDFCILPMADSIEPLSTTPPQGSPSRSQSETTTPEFYIVSGQANSTEKASQHALACAYNSLKERYNDLGRRYTEMERRYTYLQNRGSSPEQDTSYTSPMSNGRYGGPISRGVSVPENMEAKVSSLETENSSLRGLLQQREGECRQLKLDKEHLESEMKSMQSLCQELVLQERGPSSAGSPSGFSALPPEGFTEGDVDTQKVFQVVAEIQNELTMTKKLVSQQQAIIDKLQHQRSSLSIHGDLKGSRHGMAASITSPVTHSASTRSAEPAGITVTTSRARQPAESSDDTGPPILVPSSTSMHSTRRGEESRVNFYPGVSSQGELHTGSRASGYREDLQMSNPYMVADRASSPNPWEKPLVAAGSPKQLAPLPRNPFLGPDIPPRSPSGACAGATGTPFQRRHSPLIVADGVSEDSPDCGFDEGIEGDIYGCASSASTGGSTTSAGTARATVNAPIGGSPLQHRATEPILRRPPIGPPSDQPWLEAAQRGTVSRGAGEHEDLLGSARQSWPSFSAHSPSRGYSDSTRHPLYGSGHSPRPLNIDRNVDDFDVASARVGDNRTQNVNLREQSRVKDTARPFSAIAALNNDPLGPGSKVIPSQNLYHSLGPAHEDTIDLNPPPVPSENSDLRNNRICPVCVQEFPATFSMDVFQQHVLDCLGDGSEQETMMHTVPDKLCPVCNQAFADTTPQNEFEQHVNDHFERDEGFEIVDRVDHFGTPASET